MMPRFSLRPRSLFGRLLSSYLLLIFITLLLISLLFNQFVSQYFVRFDEWQRLNQANKAVGIVAGQLEPWQRSSLASSIATMAVSFDSQIWVIDASGKLIAQSQAGSAEDALFLSREEIASVLQGNSVVKKSLAERDQGMFVALPILAGSSRPGGETDNSGKGEVLGALVMRSPSGSIAESIRDVTRLILNAMLAAVVVSILIGWTLSKSLLHPLQRMNRIALQVASGNFEERVPLQPDRTPTEIHQMIATFNYAVDQIEKLINQERALETMRRDFVANVSHEFKGPLTSIRGFLELIADDRLPEDQKKKYMRLVLGDLAHLNYLVEDLLDLSQLESGKVTLHRESVAPFEMLQSAHEELHDLAAKKGIEFRVEVDESLRSAAVWVDRHRFRQVLLNLIQNALRHTPAGGSIRLEATPHDTHTVVFRVVDTGEGIAPEDLPHIWDRFYKADKAHTPSEGSGTGLGLAIVKQIVDLHGGSITVESRPNQGTTFAIHVPCPPERVEMERQRHTG